VEELFGVYPRFSKKIYCVYHRPVAPQLDQFVDLPFFRLKKAWGGTQTGTDQLRCGQLLRAGNSATGKPSRLKRSARGFLLNQNSQSGGTVPAVKVLFILKSKDSTYWNSSDHLVALKEVTKKKVEAAFPICPNDNQMNDNYSTASG